MLKTITISPYIRCQLPENWSEFPGGRGVSFRTPEGGTVTVSSREFQKPALPGMGSGMTAEQMLSAQVAEFGQVPRLLAPGRAYASHSLPIGEPGREVQCRVWHIVNQAGDWHHETVMFSYEPAPNNVLDSAVISVLDVEVPRSEFSRSISQASSKTPDDTGKSKPWWQFW